MIPQVYSLSIPSLYIQGRLGWFNLIRSRDQDPILMTTPITRRAPCANVTLVRAIIGLLYYVLLARVVAQFGENALLAI